MNKKTYVLIPARFNSSRLPGKPLKDICGLPMIIHVAMRARLSKNADCVYVCTDCDRIASEVAMRGLNVCLTKSKHSNGTERIAEACKTLGIEGNTLIIDLQGDEPLVDPGLIDRVIIESKKYLDAGADIFLPHSHPCDANNKNIVKVVSSRERVIYLSREDVPLNFTGNVELQKHLSIIGFTTTSLYKFITLAPGDLENSESIELLRALENGMHIATTAVDSDSFSVDTEFDLERARRAMEKSVVFDQYKHLI